MWRYIEWQGENTILNARGSDGLINGFAPGEAYRFAVTLPDGCTCLRKEQLFNRLPLSPAAALPAGWDQPADYTGTIFYSRGYYIQIQADTCNANTGAAFVDGKGWRASLLHSVGGLFRYCFSQPQLSAGAYGLRSPTLMAAVVPIPRLSGSPCPASLQRHLQRAPTMPPAHSFPGNF